MKKSKMRKKGADKNSKDYLFSSVTGGRGKAVMDFVENFDSKPVTYRKTKKGKFKKAK